jgi:hypothetical protein
MSGAGGKIAALAGASTAVAGTSPHTLTHVRTLAASRFPVAPSRAPPFDLFRSHASINPHKAHLYPAPSPFVVAALPKDQAQGGAAAAGALGCVGLLVGVYRIPLNRCRCTKAQLRQGGFTRKLHHMHCARCLKRTNKGVLVSFLTSPLYCAGACAMGAQVMHTAGTPVVRAVRPAWRKVRGMIGGGGSAGGGGNR